MRLPPMLWIAVVEWPIKLYMPHFFFSTLVKKCDFSAWLDWFQTFECLPHILDAVKV